MPKWPGPRISWDSTDRMQLSASLRYLETHPKKQGRQRMAAKSPIIILGTPGGWTLRANLVFYGAFALFGIFRWLGEPFAQLAVISMLTMFVVLSWSFGTVRSTKQSIIRLRVLRILRAPGDAWMDLVVDTVIADFDSLTGYTQRPGRVRRYLNSIRSLNRLDDIFTTLRTSLMSLSISSEIVFLFNRTALVALVLLISVLGWLLVIPLAFAVSTVADATRSDIPKVWQVDDLRVLGEHSKDEMREGI
jgi:hypothetical protein